MTVREAFLWGREHLTAAGSAEPAVEAELLLRHATGWDRARLYTQWDSVLSADSRSAYRALLDERATGRPVHYLLGTREFMGLSFLVDERVLIPRPETEVLAEYVVNFLRSLREPGTGNREPGRQDVQHRSWFPVPRARPLVVDVGTGSGCIAIAVAHSVPDVTVVATDISAGALEVAAGNARRHGVDGPVRFLEGDLLNALPDGLAGRVDVIVSNPPYVSVDLAATLPREIRDFEPELAVIATGDGLDVHRELVRSAPQWLRPGGLLALEVGAGQAGSLRRFLESQPGFADIRVLSDYAGIERVVGAAFRPSTHEARDG